MAFSLRSMISVKRITIGYILDIQTILTYQRKRRIYDINLQQSENKYQLFRNFYIKQWWECELKLILLVLLFYSQRVRLVMHYLFFFLLIIHTYISKMIILWLKKCDFILFFLFHLKEKEVNYISNPILTFLLILISFENNFYESRFLIDLFDRLNNTF